MPQLFVLWTLMLFFYRTNSTTYDSLSGDIQKRLLQNQPTPLLNKERCCFSSTSVQNSSNINHGILKIRSRKHRQAWKHVISDEGVLYYNSPSHVHSSTFQIEESSLPINSESWDTAAALRAGVGFADNSYSVDIAENSIGNTLVKILTLTNKPSLTFPLKCEIESGNERGHFFMRETQDRDCELRTRGQQLDYETEHQYHLTVTIKTSLSLIDPSRSLAQVVVNVLDQNDNRPTFIFDEPTNRLIPNHYFTAVALTAPAQTYICRIMAEDRDSGNNGHIIYSIVSSSHPGYFSIDNNTGIIVNIKTLEGIQNDQLPIQLIISARDMPGATSNFLSAEAPLTINLINNRSRLVLVLAGTSPDKVITLQPRLTEFLQERSGLVIGVEKIETQKGTLNVTEISGSDVTFYAVNPQTYNIMTTDNPQIKSLFLSSDGQYSLLFGMSTTLGVAAESIRQPLISTSGILLTAKTAGDVDGFQAALLALACIIIIFGIVALVYTCFIWSRYKAFQEQMHQMVISHVEPVLLETSVKEYETQMLQMTVHPDDTDSLEHPIYKDSANFLSPNGARGHLPLGSEDSSSYSITDSIGDNEALQAYSSREEYEHPNMMIPALNPIYLSSDENNGRSREHSENILLNSKYNLTRKSISTKDSSI